MTSFAWLETWLTGNHPLIKVSFKIETSIVWTIVDTKWKFRVVGVEQVFPLDKKGNEGNLKVPLSIILTKYRMSCSTFPCFYLTNMHIRKSYQAIRKLKMGIQIAIPQTQSANRPTEGTFDTNELSSRWCEVWRMWFRVISHKIRATRCFYFCFA